MITEKIFVGGKDHPVAEVDDYISASVNGAYVEFKGTQNKVIIK